MRLITILLLSFLSVVINKSYSQSISELQRLSDSIQSILDKEHIPGAFVTVVSKDSVLYKRGFGFADVALQKPTTSQHLFKIGSISKTFTALAIMKLIEEGRLSLDTKLAEIAPKVPFENQWEATHPVRIKHLLSHQAGFDDVHANMVIDREKGMTAIDEVMHMSASLKSRWEPGSGFAYSNTGCVILGYIIEEITNQRYQDYIKNEVITPLNMNSTDFRSAFADTLSSDYCSIGYRYANDEIEKSREIKIICEAAGSLMSNADDMGLFLQFLLNKETSDGQIVSPSIIEHMEAVHGDLEVENHVSEGYYYGLAIWPRPYGTKNICFAGHGGDIHGFSSLFIYNRELDLGIALSINRMSSTKKLTKLLVDTFTSHVEKANQVKNIDGSKLIEWEGEYQRINTRNQWSNFFMHPLMTVNVDVTDKKVSLGRFLNSKNEVYVNQKGSAFTKGNHFIPSLYFIEKDGEKFVRYKEELYKPVNKVWLLVLRILLVMSIIIGVIAILVILIQGTIALFKKSWRTNNLKGGLISGLSLICMVLAAIVMNFSSSDELIGTFSFVSAFICLTTTIFPIAAVWGVYWMMINWNTITNKMLRAYYGLVVFSGLFLSVYFIYHGWFMKMTWV